MTASLLTGVDIGKPALVPVHRRRRRRPDRHLRYDDLRAVRQFLARATKPGSGCTIDAGVFLGLIEAIVDRTADVLERISDDVDRINQESSPADRKRRQRGRKLEDADRATSASRATSPPRRARASSSLERLVQYAGLALPGAYAKGANRARLKLAGRDIRSLEDHVTFLSNKITFLLDATLGLISVAAERGDPHPDRRGDRSSSRRR